MTPELQILNQRLARIESMLEKLVTAPPRVDSNDMQLHKGKPYALRAAEADEAYRRSQIRKATRRAA
jgi:hypothetical protein